MSRATEFSKNVWQGPTPDYLLQAGTSGAPSAESFDLMIDANDLAGIPGPRHLANLAKRLAAEPQRLEFPSSGSLLLPSGESRDVDDLINTLRWIFYLANPEIPETDAEGDIPMDESPKKSRKILIHCPDGYTESSLLVIAYTMFAEGIPASEAWLRLHREKKRNFFAYPSDVAFLRNVQEKILQESPANPAKYRLTDPRWFNFCDGSLPSRILPYMYLGNLSHANNPEMLWELGIRRVLSIGEAVSWTDSDFARMGAENVMHITKVQDNGIDPLTQEFDRCLEFIRKFLLCPDGPWVLKVNELHRQGKIGWCGYSSSLPSGGLTFSYDMHRRSHGIPEPIFPTGIVSATLTLYRGVTDVFLVATSEREDSMSSSNPIYDLCKQEYQVKNTLTKANKTHRYELLKWEELQQKKNKQPLKRELEWATVAREIALMNKPYSR